MSNRGRRRIDRSLRKMYKSVCAECGNDCEVPFRPTGDRPVYCRECFAKRKPPRTEDRSRRGDLRGNRQRRRSSNTENVNLQILSELKRIREALEKSLV